MQNSPAARDQRERLGSIPEIHPTQRKHKSQAPPPPKVTSMTGSTSTSSFVVKCPSSSASNVLPPSVSIAPSSTLAPAGVGAVPKKRPAPKRPQSDDGSDTPSDGSARSVTVTLKRQQHAPLGFSIRGGREHGTGVYVSQVDANSEAETAGIKAGDQILKVNGFPVDQFVHAEVCMMLKQNNVVTLKLSGTGMLPVKDRGDVVLKPVSDVDKAAKQIIPLPPAEPNFNCPPTAPPAPIPPAPPAPPNTMRPIPPPMPTHMFVSELHSVAQQLRKLQITKDIALENPLLKQVAINQQQHDKLMSEFKEAHRKMFGQGERFPDDFSDTDRTMERPKAERTEVLCMKNGETAVAPGLLRSAASSSSMLSLKTDSGRGSASPCGSSPSSPASSIVDAVTEARSGDEKSKSSATFGVQLKSLRRETSNLELSSPSKVEAKAPLRRERSSLELTSLTCGTQQKSSSSVLSAVSKEVAFSKKTSTQTAPAYSKELLKDTQSVPLVQAFPFGSCRREPTVPLEKQFIVQDKNIKRENSSYIIPKKEFEKPEFKRELAGSAALDIRGFETIPEDPFVNNRTGRTEVIFIRNSRENGRDIETSSVISSDEGSTYSGSSGCGELVGRLRRQFEDPGSDSDSSGSAGGKGPGLFAKRGLGPVASAPGGKITVSIGVAALPKNAC
ncbi:pdzk7-like [Tropilaelaps mercedesae]|uniref:Pdzk7-like n=1 Tax=Tropilaelaps mercedesae TaxID=418985 RepID=A0A1V9X4M5_9ACAR|nr:pdzk7-like [Tropilaelaps mercedesae]